MAGTLADLVQAQNSGYETGKGQAQPNGLGLFIRTMLAEQQKNKQLMQETEAKKELIQTEYDIKYKSPQGVAELAKTQAEGGLKGQELTLKQEAKTAYDAGDRSPEVLKALDMYATPNIFNLMGSGGMPSISDMGTNPLPAKKPKYDPAKEKLQYNSKTGQYRVVPK
jgi:hypothetical protein